MIAYPVPVPAGAPPWLGIVLVVAAAGAFVVLVVQAVRYLRRDRGDDR